MAVQKAKFNKCEEEGGGLWAWSTVSAGKRRGHKGN